MTVYGYGTYHWHAVIGDPTRGHAIARALTEAALDAHETAAAEAALAALTQTVNA